ncbi:hypothetical protein RSAG8_04504, partial [Rhizoctonia solani AG-8 WAC10335]
RRTSPRLCIPFYTNDRDNNRDYHPCVQPIVMLISLATVQE